MARLRNEWTCLRTKWAGLPRWARWVLAVYLAGFADGTAAHVRALAEGGIALDMAANWIGNWHLLPADPARLLRTEGGLLLITSFGLFVLLSARPMLRVMKN